MSFCVTVVNNKSNVFKCLFNTHLDTLNVPEMCFKCVSNVFKCVWRTFGNVLVSNVCRTHLNTFETHLKHIWGTFNVFKCVINKHLNTFDLLFTAVTIISCRNSNKKHIWAHLQHIWNTVEAHLAQMCFVAHYELSPANIWTHYGAQVLKTHLE